MNHSLYVLIGLLQEWLQRRHAAQVRFLREENRILRSRLDQQRLILAPDERIQLLAIGTIARHLVRSSIKVSRSWVQQHLSQPKPTSTKPKPSIRPVLVPPDGKEPDHLRAPGSINETWHLDLATLNTLWFKFTLGALMNGYSRKLLGLRVCRGKASSWHAIQLVNDAVEP